MVVRLPRIHWAVGGVDKDFRWLPLLAPLLPVAIPVPLAKGIPAEGYPWEWGVYPWLEGENPTVDNNPSGVRQPVPAEGARPFGPAAAVMLAAGIGIFILGLLTTLAEASTGIKDGLQWNDRVGPLSGKTIIASAVFFGAWPLLAAALRRREPQWKTVVYATAALIALGLLMTFPTFFQAFAPD